MNKAELVDAVSKEIVRNFVKKINKEKKVTVILTTHDMADITSLAKRIILIGKGKVLYDGSLLKLKNKYDTTKYVEITTKDTINIEHDGILSTEKLNEGYKYTLNTKLINISDFLNIISKQAKIENIEIEAENIDSIIVKMYKEYEI